MVAVGVNPGWCRLRKVQTRSRPAASRLQHQPCLRRTRVYERTFVLPPMAPALSSPNVSRSMYTAESSDKEQTDALAVWNISTVCFERAFGRGPLCCGCPSPLACSSRRHHLVTDPGCWASARRLDVLTHRLRMISSLQSIHRLALGCTGHGLWYQGRTHRRAHHVSDKVLH